MNLDMNALLKQAQEMQQQMAEAQAAAKDEIAEASAGGGMVTAKANGAGELVGLEIDPRAIDPDDPEMLGDMVLAAANEALLRQRRDPRSLAGRRGEAPQPVARSRRARFRRVGMWTRVARLAGERPVVLVRRAPAGERWNRAKDQPHVLAQ